MTSLLSIVRGVIGLFIDDGSLALTIVAWVISVALAIRVGIDPKLASLILFSGLAALLAWNVWQFARRERSRP